MPALSIATSVPVPMAMPTSAAASAGASLTPSPAIATTRPVASQLFDHRVLGLGQHLGLDLGDAELARHRHRGGAVVAGQHDDGDAFGLAAPRAPLRPTALTGSAMAISARDLAVDGDEDRGRALAPQPLGVALQAARSRCSSSARNRALPSTTRRRSTMPIAPLPVGESKPRTGAKLDACARPPPRRSRGRADARSTRSTLAASRSISVFVETRRRS